MEKVVSIIIPTAFPENKAMLNNLLADIQAHTTHPHEIILVKNNFDGFTAPVNRGIKETYLNDVVVMSDDLRIHEDGWLKKLRDCAYSSSNIGAVTASTLFTDKKHPIQNYTLGGFNPIYIKRKTINRIGLLDENIKFFFEEDDYCLRMAIVGLKVEKISINMSHDRPETTVKNFNREFFYSRAKRYFEKKWSGEYE